MTDHAALLLGVPAITKPVDTHCPYCALQCGMTLTRDTADWTVSARDFPTNKGGLCRKGWTSAALLSAPDRLTTPLIRDRKGMRLRPASWNEALDRIVTDFRRIQAEHGADAVGVFGGGGLTNEKAYLLGKFARLALGTANIDYNGRFCMASAAAAGQRAFGIDRGLPFPLDDIPGAEVILLPGGNPAETMPPIMQYFAAQKRRGGKLIVADPRRTPTARAADLHLQLTPGTDAALANGLMNIAIRDRLLNDAFIKQRTTGFDAVRRICASYWPDRVERITGVPAAQLQRAAHMLGEAATAMLLTARGAEQQRNGTDNVLAYINLILALGHAGRKHCGYGCLTGQGNGQGGREHGQKADQLPGYRKLDNPRHRAEVATVWGVEPGSLPGPGLSACELLGELGSKIRGLFVVASNLLISAPDADNVSGGIGGLDLMVVADMFLSETARRADVVLPITQWAEEDGTMTNLEGRVLLRRRAQAPPPGVWTDLEIFHALAERLGCSARFDTEPGRVFDELRQASSGGPADYAGITYERIAKEDGVFWPCPDHAHPGTPRLFLDGFATADGRARFHPIQYRGPAETPDREFPYVLTTGRVLSHYQTGAQTRRVAELCEAEPDAFVEINLDTARGLGVAAGDMVRLTTRRGTAELRARVNRDIRLDTLFVPFHWSGQAAVNRLTNAALDPVSRIPEFKVCAVRIEKMPAARASSAAANPSPSSRE
ncbi:molybdopterin oxidoreductase family protein [Rhodopila sp.]|uniref:molybdopterin oxidoreductase family protein n=1 Tax=Rhodopila sp. TaxID=2480087 RepID=UPI003D0E774C